MSCKILTPSSTSVPKFKCMLCFTKKNKNKELCCTNEKCNVNMCVSCVLNYFIIESEKIYISDPKHFRTVQNSKVTRHGMPIIKQENINLLKKIDEIKCPFCKSGKIGDGLRKSRKQTSKKIRSMLSDESLKDERIRVMWLYDENGSVIGKRHETIKGPISWDHTLGGLVGCRISVMWKGRKWYKGTVDWYDDLTGRHRVKYDDGDIREYELFDNGVLKNRFRLIE